MDPYAGGWVPQGHAVGGMIGGGGTVPRCWERTCRSTDPSPMRPIEHSTHSAEQLRCSMESMRSIDSIVRQPPTGIEHDVVRHRRHPSSRSMESMRSQIDQQIRTEQPRSSTVDHMSASSSMASVAANMRNTVEHHAIRAMDHPCRLKDHANYIPSDHIVERGLSHDHVSRVLEHRLHEASHHPARLASSIDQATANSTCRFIDHPNSIIRPESMSYSCRSIEHPATVPPPPPGRPMPMDCVIFGPHTHPPPRLPIESRMNCPVHSPFRYRFLNGMGIGNDYHSHQVKSDCFKIVGLTMRFEYYFDGY